MEKKNNRCPSANGQKTNTILLNLQNVNPKSLHYKPYDELLEAGPIRGALSASSCMAGSWRSQDRHGLEVAAFSCKEASK